MALLDGIRYFTREKDIMQCLSVTCGTADREWTAVDGWTDADKRHPADENTLYDLASLTKLFTGVSVMKLAESGMLRLDAPVTYYLPDYPLLGSTTIDEVLGFEVSLVTPERVDTQPDREAGLAVMKKIAAFPQGTGRYYSDMQALLLGLLLERVTGQPLYEVFQSLILQPLGMSETFVRVPENRLTDCVFYDREHRIEGSRWILREGILPGQPHDPKARLLGDDGRYVSGHAGLFSTRRDMVRLCRGLLSGKLLTEASLLQMSRNRLGRQLPDGSWTQFLGSLCYVRHPVQFFSEIPVYMGRRSIGLSGFTGHHIAVDPEHGRFSLFLGNRVLNRLTVLVPEKGRTLEDYGLNPDGSGHIRWTDSEVISSSVDYVHQKDEQLHRRIMEETGWQTIPFTE